MDKENSKNGCYTDGFKEAKRLISEGRAQQISAQNLMDNEKYENLLDANYHRLTETQLPGETRDEIIMSLSTIEKRITDREKTAEQKANDSVEKIMQGLDVYRSLLTYENEAHFGRIKTAITYTLNEFGNMLPANAYEKYHTALFIGPE